MELLITGIPVRFWKELRHPIRRRIEKLLEDAGAPCGELKVTFFGVWGKEQPLLVATNGPE